MNFIDKIKNLFSNKKIEEVVDEETGEGPICYWCDCAITKEHTKKSFNGAKFHIQCYRQMIKYVKKDANL